MGSTSPAAPTVAATANSLLSLSSVLSGALGIVSLIYPPAAPIIAIVERAAPYLIAAKPLIEAAIKEGPGAFAAATKAAPQLGKAISDLASHLLPTGVFGTDPSVVLENVSRALVGFGHMTPEQEKAWMDRATPGNDPSQENSKYTVG